MKTSNEERQIAYAEQLASETGNTYLVIQGFGAMYVVRDRPMKKHESIIKTITGEQR